MSVCGCLFWYWSFYTHCALRRLATCSHAVIEHWNWKQRLPRGLLFIISLYVVQISQDMASVSLETCLPCSIQAWNVMCVMCNAGEKDPQWELYAPEKCDSSRLETKHVWLPWFVLNKIQPAQTAATCWQKTNNVQLFKILPEAIFKWQGCEIFRRWTSHPWNDYWISGLKCLFE